VTGYPEQDDPCRCTCSRCKAMGKHPNRDHDAEEERWGLTPGPNHESMQSHNLPPTVEMECVDCGEEWDSDDGRNCPGCGHFGSLKEKEEEPEDSP
jgi:hypothetical protein